jgi:ABC-type maltose transport system permease subunit
MYAKVANFFVYLGGAWLLSGRFLASLVFALVITALAAVGYAWSTIQFFGATLLIIVFLRMSGLLPV